MLLRGHRKHRRRNKEGGGGLRLSPFILQKIDIRQALKIGADTLSLV